MAKIKQIDARQILNASGNPTLEVMVTLGDNTTATSSVPSGTAIGNYEAAQMQDISRAISIIKDQIAPHLLGMEGGNQREVDRIMIELDGTQNKSRLGANTTISVSMAVAKAAAQSSVLPLFLYLREFVKREPQDTGSRKIPTPIFAIMNGGKAYPGRLDFKEILLVPASSKTFSESLKMSILVYQSLRRILQSNNSTPLITDSGGFCPNVSKNQDALFFFKEAMEGANLRIGFDAFFGLDPDASDFYKDGSYHIKDRSQPLSAKDLVTYYAELNNTFHLLYLEDPLSQDDWEGWKEALAVLSNDSIIVGDNLTATNPYRLQMALDKKAVTGITIKPSQIGTVMESLAVLEIARHMGLKTIVASRSEETNDDFIADFAVAVSSDYMKLGAPVKGENVAKYNRLLQIEKQLALL